MSGHGKTQVNTDFLKWLNSLYGKHGEVKAHRDKRHDYLVMTLDFSEKGKVDMSDNIKAIVDDFPVKFEDGETVPSPAGDDLLVKKEGIPLDKQMAAVFHTFACKRARPDVHTAIAVLCSRVKNPTEDD
jgi:hypothetical protein